MKKYKNVWVVDDEYKIGVMVFSNPSKAYDEMVKCWSEDNNPPAYSTFLKKLKAGYYSNVKTVVYKTQIL